MPGAAPGVAAATWPSAPRSACTQPVLRAVFSKVDTLAVLMAWFLPAPFPAEYKPLALAHAQTPDHFLTVADLDWIYASPAQLIEPGERTARFPSGADWPPTHPHRSTPLTIPAHPAAP